jgi:hypothetical protein
LREEGAEVELSRWSRGWKSIAEEHDSVTATSRSAANQTLLER